MALVPWEPKEIKRLRDLFDDFFDSELLPESRRLTRRRWMEGGEWSPLVDVIDKKDSILVKAELPGVDKKDVKISLSENTLTIRGERKEEKEIKKEDYYCCERAFGTYSRSITLPVEVDKTKAKATFKNGILEITLPKIEETKPKEIEIQPE
ncbi:MAG TPA: Hsp20/alpha crystallin family protein [Candidatus Atribacteria bacterium]|nr:Hsp20/alpha crystallin family protein [Candidatus Atribacteria bacterium]